MSWTKRQLIQQAFAKIGLAAHAFDVQPDQLSLAKRSLDMMAASWEDSGIFIRWPIPAHPDSEDLDTAVDAPERAIEAIVLNLAISIAPEYGKAVSPDTKQRAYQTYQQLLNKAARPSEQQLPSTLPRGAGNRGGEIFIDEPEDKIEVRPGDELSLE